MVRGKLLAVAAVALVALGGGIAWAAIPDGGGVIHGCYLKGLGTLRVIDPAKEHCSAALEVPLQWNAQGPQGPQGIQGPPGPKGDAGAPGPTYAAGTGLDLSGSTFDVAGSYQLPQRCALGQSPFLAGFPPSHPWSCFTAANAGESCSGGRFVNGIDASGDVTCDAPPGGGPSRPDIWVSRHMEDQDTPVDIPVTVATLSLPAGSFLLTGEAVANGDQSDDDVGTGCDFDVDPNGPSGDTDLGVEVESLSVNDVVTLGAPTDVDFVCDAARPHSHVSGVLMTALEVGAVH
ncbi:MAG TPA: hypothetical protein VFA30_08830 [Gaiellaceae bacterium]|nr:hypothetical protein [Gaiellaceae bacterium]